MDYATSARERGRPGAHRLILCGDMVATDAYCVRLLETLDDSFVAPRSNSLVQRAVAMGLGEEDLSRVDIIELTA